MVKTRIISTAIHRPPPGVGVWRLQVTGALEEHVASYDKRAHGRITAIDTRLSNGSIISNNNNNNNNNNNKSLCPFFVFYTAIPPHEDKMHVDCILRAH